MNDAPDAPRCVLSRRPMPGGSRAGRHGRAVVLVLALAILWTLLLAVAASVPLGAGFEPAVRLRHAGSDFGIVTGAGIANGRRLGIAAAGTDHLAMQSHVLDPPVDAADFPVLRHRWQDFPRTLELSFMCRRADAPGDVQTISLPAAGSHPAYFDLRDVPAWRGRITEIGFAEFPTAQLVPADAAFQPFALVETELWAPSWRGSLGALGTDWFAYRPWALMSVSALGPDAPWRHKVSPTLVLAAGLFASVLLAACVLGRGRRWAGAALCFALGAGWIALDLRWLAEFAGRDALTRDLYAGKPWSERAAIEPDTELLAAARRVQTLLAREPATTHVVVAADTAYTMLRLDYHLLPANAAPFEMLPRPLPASPAPTLLLVYADPRWLFDARDGTLRGPGSAFRASSLLDEGDLRVFRLGASLP